MNKNAPQPGGQQRGPQQQQQPFNNNKTQGGQGTMGIQQPPIPGQLNQMQVQQPVPQQQMQMIQLSPIDVTPLSQLQGQQKNEFVGNSIYGHIQGALGDEYAPRITGMLIAENAGIDFTQLLTDSAYFTSKVFEAHNLILSSKQE